MNLQGEVYRDIDDRKTSLFLLMEMVFYKTEFWSRRNGGEFIIPKNLIIP